MQPRPYKQHVLHSSETNCSAYHDNKSSRPNSPAMTGREANAIVAARSARNSETAMLTATITRATGRCCNNGFAAGLTACSGLMETAGSAATTAGSIAALATAGEACLNSGI